MITISNYVKVKSLEEAYELNKKKTNTIIGGMLWLKMSKKNINTAIDLSNLGLDKIEENNDEYKIGCMTTLRDLEINESLDRYTNGAIKDSLKHIVGVQFRNCATIGGSIYGRFGFSDILTCLLALECYVELYKGGIIPMSEFAQMNYDNDILVNIIIKKKPIKVAYMSQRNCKTDFPVITCAVSIVDNKVFSVIGARPAKAVRMEDSMGILSKEMSEENILEYANYIANNIKFGSNMRASKEFRQHLCKVLVKRTLISLKEVTDNAN